MSQKCSKCGETPTGIGFYKNNTTGDIICIDCALGVKRPLTNIDITFNYKYRQQNISMKGRITHLQRDPHFLQIFITDIPEDAVVVYVKPQNKGDKK
jgi:transcription initiation factor TFIIIB Brf1 subunit/transcription initiation factor TFIIB